MDYFDVPDGEPGNMPEAATLPPTSAPAPSPGFFDGFGDSLKSTTDSLLKTWGTIKGVEYQGTALDYQSKIQLAQLQNAGRVNLMQAQNPKNYELAKAQFIGGGAGVMGMTWMQIGLIGVAIFAAAKFAKK